jgi:hypothetical protein
MMDLITPTTLDATCKRGFPTKKEQNFYEYKKLTTQFAKVACFLFYFSEKFV